MTQFQVFQLFRYGTVVTFLAKFSFNIELEVWENQRESNSQSC